MIYIFFSRRGQTQNRKEKEKKNIDLGKTIHRSFSKRLKRGTSLPSLIRNRNLYCVFCASSSSFFFFSDFLCVATSFLLVTPTHPTKKRFPLPAFLPSFPFYSDHTVQQLFVVGNNNSFQTNGRFQGYTKQKPKKRKDDDSAATRRTISTSPPHHPLYCLVVVDDNIWMFQSICSRSSSSSTR